MMPLILPNVKFRIITGSPYDEILQKENYVIGDLLIDEIDRYYQSEKKGFIYIQKRYGLISEIEYPIRKFRGILQAMGCQIIENVEYTNNLTQINNLTQNDKS